MNTFKSNEEEVEELIAQLKKLTRLLEVRQFGLYTWWMMVVRQLTALRENIQRLQFGRPDNKS